MDYYDLMPNPATTLACLALALAALPGCAPLATSAADPAITTASTAAPAAAAKPPPPKPAPPAQSALTARLMYELLVGEISFDMGDPQQGAAYLLDAARRTGDESLYKRATEMAIQSRAGPAALEAVRAWREAHPQSLEAIRY